QAAAGRARQRVRRFGPHRTVWCSLVLTRWINWRTKALTAWPLRAACCPTAFSSSGGRPIVTCIGFLLMILVEVGLRLESRLQPAKAGTPTPPCRCQDQHTPTCP